MYWIVYAISFVAIFGGGIWLLSLIPGKPKDDENSKSKSDLSGGLISLFLLIAATIGAMLITNEMGLSTKSYSPGGYDRPGIGPYEY